MSKKAITMSENEKSIFHTYFCNGGNTKDCNIITELKGVDSLIEIKTMCAYRAFCAYNTAITNSPEKLANAETMRKKYETAVTDLVRYCGINDKKAFYALFAQCCYKVTTIGKGEEKSNFKRIPFEFKTVYTRVINLISTMIFDNIDNTLTAFETYVLNKKTTAKSAYLSANSALDKHEKEVAEFKKMCTFFGIPEEDEKRIAKMNEYSAKCKKLTEKRDNAKKAYDDICEKSIEIWENEFLKEYNVDSIF